MGYANSVGKYHLRQTIGEGMFATVKLGVDSTNGQYVAIKILDKHRVMESNLKYQVQREIRTMNLLNHPNIVGIHKVICTKTKIYLVMEYVPCGQLSDKLEARKAFQQLIDAVNYCHNRGIYHRDLKPENLLLYKKGNVKVSDFGLSALHKPGGLLTTACGSPCYVAPELIANRGYNGAAADVWSCGISRPEYSCPEWFTKSQKRQIARILEPNIRKQITIPEIMEDEWFQADYVPSCGQESPEKINLDDVNAAFDSIEDHGEDAEISRSSSFINAFQLKAMSQDLDLSGLFEGKEDKKEKTRQGSKHTLEETVKKIEAAARDVSLSIEMTRNSKVIEVTPTNCLIEISKSARELTVYQEFCKSLSSLLSEKSNVSKQTHDKQKLSNGSNLIKENLSSEEQVTKEG